MSSHAQIGSRPGEDVAALLSLSLSLPVCGERIVYIETRNPTLAIRNIIIITIRVWCIVPARTFLDCARVRVRDLSKRAYLSCPRVVFL